MCASLLVLSLTSTSDDRKFRDAAKALLSPDQLLGYINILTSSLWPGGELKPKSVPRTLGEKIGTRDSANRKLSALMPGGSHSLVVPSMY